MCAAGGWQDAGLWPLLITALQELPRQCHLLSTQQLQQVCLATAQLLSPHAPRRAGSWQRPPAGLQLLTGRAQAPLARLCRLDSSLHWWRLWESRSLLALVR